MNPLINAAFNTILANKHTSGAAAVYALAKWGCPILSAWFPSRKEALDITAGYLEGAAVFYGFASAGDSAKSATKEDVSVLAQTTATAIQTGDTDILTKKDIKPINPS